MWKVFSLIKINLAMAQKILSKKKNWYGADNVTYENQFECSKHLVQRLFEMLEVTAMEWNDANVKRFPMNKI